MGVIALSLCLREKIQGATGLERKCGRKPGLEEVNAVQKGAGVSSVLRASFSYISELLLLPWIQEGI